VPETQSGPLLETDAVGLTETFTVVVIVALQPVGLYAVTETVCIPALANGHCNVAKLNPDPPAVIVGAPVIVQI
jgi:hypothetical protein